MKKSGAPAFLLIFFIGLAVVAQLPAQVVEIDGRLFRKDMKILDGSQTASLPSLLSIADTLPGFPLIKPDFMVNSTGGDYGAEQSGPNIAIDSSGNCAVAWIDTRNNDNKGQASARQLHYFDPLNRYNVDYYNSNSADIFQDKLLFAYESNKQGGTGYDIWTNAQRLDGINFEPELYLPPVNDDVLHQNFPNPFNSKTSIAYEIHSFHKVNVAIFDILGREVKVLVDQYQEKGVYVVDFDASDLPSGFYYCRLKAFKTSVIKMLLIR